MTINIKEDTSKLTRVVSELIGHRLSTTRGIGGTRIPSVILKRQNIDKPERPFALVDYGNNNPIGRDTFDIYLNDNLDEVVQTFSEQFFIIEVVGGELDDPIGTLKELSSRLLSTKGKRLLNQALGDSYELLDIGEIISSSAYLETGFQETARIILTFNNLSTLTDDTTGTIDTMSYIGTMYDDYDQEKFPIRTQKNVPIN